MQRIQLYLSKSLRGFKTLVSINATEAGVRYIRDVRQALEAVDYDCSEKCVFYLIQYVEGATLVTVLRTIPDKAGDHLAATLVLPEGILVPAADLDGILKRITRKVSNPGMSQQDIAELQLMLQTEYPVDPEPAYRQPCRGNAFACRRYGADTGLQLIDFLGDALYQVSAANYAGLLLVDGDLPFDLLGTDLSAEPLTAPVRLIPPVPVAGYSVSVYGRPFDRPIAVAPHTPLNVVWKREGSEPIIQPVFVGATDCTPQSPVVPAPPATKKITPQSFYITSRYSNMRLNGCTIEVNGIAVGDGRDFTLDDIRNAEVRISAPGYISYRGNLDLSATSQALVELVERAHPDPTTGAATGETTADDTERAVADSIASHTKRHRQRRRKQAMWKKLAMLAVGVCGTTLLAMWFLPDLTGNVFGGAQDANPNSIAGMRMQPGDSLNGLTVADNAPAGVDSQAAAQSAPAQAVAEAPKAAAAPAAESAPAAADSKASAASAAKYLDDKTPWTKAEMEANPTLKAYYADLMAYNLDALANKWPGRIPDSKWVKRVAEHAAAAQRKKLDPKAKGNPYAKNGDKIHRIEYVNWIDRSQK